MFTAFERRNRIVSRPVHILELPPQQGQAFLERFAQGFAQTRQFVLECPVPRLIAEAGLAGQTWVGNHVTQCRQSTLEVHAGQHTLEWHLGTNGDLSGQGWTQTVEFLVPT